MATDFGRDVSCTTSIRSGRYASGPRLIAEAAYRRLTTPRAMLRGGEDEANYGIDLTEYVGTTNPKATAASLPGRIRSELTKDERIVSVDTTVTTVTDGAVTSFLIDVTAETTQGPFTLGVSVNDVSVELLRVEA